MHKPNGNHLSVFPPFASILADCKACLMAHTATKPIVAGGSPVAGENED